MIVLFCRDILTRAIILSEHDVGFVAWNGTFDVLFAFFCGQIVDHFPSEAYLSNRRKVSSKILVCCKMSRHCISLVTEDVFSASG